MRILHAHNLMLRHYGKRNSYSGRKFSNGIIRANHNLYEFSDRDIVRYEAPFAIRPLGIKKMNRKFLETCENFRPDFLLIGHCDLISSETLSEVRKILPSVKISQWFLDALWIDRNISRLKERMHHLDSIFITTGGEQLRMFCTGKNKVCFIPNPCDASIETSDNSTKDNLNVDLLFCGVGSKSDKRYAMLRELDSSIGETLNFQSYGIYGRPPIWGSLYEDLLPHVKMALNLNREEGWFMYSSDRISQLMGNGILSFLPDESGMRKLLCDEQVVFFKNQEDLEKKIIHFHHNDDHRKAISAAGRKLYHEQFSAMNIINFIIETTFDIPHTFNYSWSSEVYS